LQAIIQQSQQGAVEHYIPTRDTTESTLDYDRYYHNVFREPHTYIRFSSTVEDCLSGAPYCMSEDDDGFLKDYNSRQKSPKTKCPEATFEYVMNFFEETARDKQEYAARIGDVPELSLEEMESSPYIEEEEILPPEAKKFVGKPFHDHWVLQRKKRFNQPLMPTLKFERNMEADESDPYVCFRRREHRQVRKTRGRDAQVNEKLKRLRNELELARQLMHNVKMREHFRQTQFEVDKRVFEHRHKVKDTKRHLGIKEGDEDLVNQKVCRCTLPFHRAFTDAPF
jgi:enhancer of polycomb-like protein